MTPERIAELLQPFLEAPVSYEQLNQISIYIDLLLRWNARINLTAVRTAEEIVTRHFGESLFAARHLLPASGATDVPPVGVRQAHSRIRNDIASQTTPEAAQQGPIRAVDLGSGAGFPGIPLKIWSPQTTMTLIESNHKKTAFLREAIRALTLTSIDVFPGRAEDFPKASADLLTLRAVERFESILPTAQSLLAPAARLALLIGESQTKIAREFLPLLVWSPAIPLPDSHSRVLLVGTQTSN